MKIKSFSHAPEEIEKQVNTWLKEHDKDVQIVNMFHSTTAISNTVYVTVTYIYRELVDPGNPAEGREPKFE